MSMFKIDIQFTNRCDSGSHVRLKELENEGEHLFCHFL